MKKFKIGIIKFTNHASLNRIEAGIKKCLDDLGAKHGVIFDYDGLVFDGEANIEKMRQIGDTFVKENVDLVVSIATPPTVAIKDILANQGIKMYFYAVSDPISAGVIDSFEHPGKFITGMSDALDGNLLCKVMSNIIPNMQKVALLYDTAQISSKMPIAEIKKYLNENNIEYIEKTPTCKNEVKGCAEEIIKSGAQAVLTPTDNTIMSAELEISPLFTNAGIPQFTGSHAFVLNGAFCGLGGYYTSGDKQFTIAIEKMLIQNISPNDIPVIRGNHGFVAINNQIADKLHIDIDALKNAVTNMGLDTVLMDSNKEFDLDSNL